MALLRTERKDYGGVEAWDDRDPWPVYFLSGAVDQATLDAVMSERQAERAIAAKLAKVDTAAAEILDKLAGWREEARQAVIDNPALTLTQLRTAFVNRVKAWAASWS